MQRLNIALIGFRATGKSTVGEILARKLGLRFIDMDRRLASESGRDIDTWVKQEGWGSFRRAESRLLQTISLHKGLVVATGGGIVLDPQNRTMLREHFFTVWLKAAPPTIQTRLNADPGSPRTRPPLSDLPIQEEIIQILAEREPLYSQVADLEIDTGVERAVRIAEQIVKAVNKMGSGGLKTHH